MKGLPMKGLATLSVFTAMVVLAAVPASAQLNGSHLLGDSGVRSGTQPGPGFYAAFFYYRYSTDTIKDREGNIIRPFPDSPSSMALGAY